jgi:hypothetical protein
MKKTPLGCYYHKNKKVKLKIPYFTRPNILRWRRIILPNSIVITVH